jgi:hypothetical protein
MKGLMYFCANWGGVECQLKDLGRKWHRMIRNDLEKFSWPHWDKIGEYDKCCRSCKKSLLFAKEDECVFCRNGKLEVLYNPIKQSGAKDLFTDLTEVSSTPTFFQSEISILNDILLFGLAMKFTFRIGAGTTNH